MYADMPKKKRLSVQSSAVSKINTPTPGRPKPMGADGCEGLVFNRWIADMKWLGIAIPWDDFI